MVVFQSNVEDLKYVLSVVGEQVFCQCVFLKDAWNDNAIHGAIESGKLDMIKVMFDIEEIKRKCKDDQDELHSIVAKVNTNFKISIAKYIVKELDLNETKLNELKEYKHFDTTKIVSVL